MGAKDNVGNLCRDMFATNTSSPMYGVPQDFLFCQVLASDESLWNGFPQNCQAAVKTDVRNSVIP